MWDWWRNRRARRNCWHHDRENGTTWIDGHLIDLGRRKIFWCFRCGQTWIV